MQYAHLHGLRLPDDNVELAEQRIVRRLPVLGKAGQVAHPQPDLVPQRERLLQLLLVLAHFQRRNFPLRLVPPRLLLSLLRLRVYQLEQQQPRQPPQRNRVSTTRCLARARMGSGEDAEEGLGNK
eukprot:8205286-Pyramimonas_sp.AAC.2